jgi:hypothetical protein
MACDSILADQAAGILLDNLGDLRVDHLEG